MLAVLRPAEPVDRGAGRCRRAFRARRAALARARASRCTSTEFCCSAAGSTSSAAISPPPRERVERGARTARRVAAAQLAAICPARRPPGSASGGPKRWPTPTTRRPSSSRPPNSRFPQPLAVDSVRYAIGDADARMRWATHVSARMLAGAFAVAWEWGNTELVSELVEYHSARGTFSAEPASQIADWAETATAAVPVDDVDEYALVAAGSPSSARRRADPARAAAAAADGPGADADHEPLPRTGVRSDTAATSPPTRPAWSTWP